MSYSYVVTTSSAITSPEATYRDSDDPFTGIAIGAGDREVVLNRLEVQTMTPAAGDSVQVSLQLGFVDGDFSGGGIYPVSPMTSNAPACSATAYAGAPTSPDVESLT